MKPLLGLTTGLALTGAMMFSGGVTVDVAAPTQVVIGDTAVPLAWTDDNTGENLIIQSSLKQYTNTNTVIFSITNTSLSDQNVDIHFLTPNQKWLVSNVNKFTGNQQVADASSTLKTQPVFTSEKIAAKPAPVVSRKDSQGELDKGAFSDFIPTGQTSYYTATIDYPADYLASLPMSERLASKSFVTGEFFIEAFGDQGGYGHLDPSTLLTSLTSYYKYSGNSNDSVVSNNGTDTNVTYVAGEIGQAASVNNTGWTDHTSAVGGTAAFTYNAWFKPGTQSGGDGYYGLMGKGSAGLNSALYLFANGNMAAYINATAQVAKDPVTASVDETGNVWTMITLTYDSTNGLAVYQNCVVKGTTAANGNAQNPTGSFYTAREGVSTTRNYNGGYDELGVWTRALTVAELCALYKSGAGLQYPFASTALWQFFPY